ncbi:15698_t:CDS:10 [Racocetra fulgida]|uniref:15698_t:CDS:1 n=1 Tax=Racocetra fulgida TaxID=60492 RepID=A0A9N9FUG9_9GLOM|nr:15698_t:CDS:10 [Racocetra fulgida]
MEATQKELSEAKKQLDKNESIIKKNETDIAKLYDELSKGAEILTEEQIKSKNNSLRAATAPVVYVCSGFDGDATVNYVRGSDGERDTNTVSKSQNKLNHLLSDNQEKIIKRLEDLEKKTGQLQPIDRIKDTQKLSPEELKDLLDKARQASPEERKRIMDEIITKTRQEQEAINKILQEDRNKQEKKMLKTLEEAKQAEQQGDKIKASQLFAEARQHQQTINTQNELIAELKKKQVEREKMAKELTQEIDNPWYKDLNFSSWQVWIILLAITNPRCQGKEIENGLAKEGNYFVGGECNYGGQHKMSDDLKQINQNFRAFDVLDESGVGFFYGSCVGLDEQLHKFQGKLKQLDKLNTEATQLTEDWKNEKDPIKKAKLFALLSQKNQEIKRLREELKTDPTFAIFTQEKNDELANIVKNIFQGNASFFSWKKKGDKGKNNEGLQSKKYLGFIPHETGKNALLITGGLLGLFLIWRLVRKKLDKEHKEAQIKATRGWEADSSHYNVQGRPEVNDCMEVEGVDEPNSFPGKLLFSPEITNFFKDILQDIEDLVRFGEVNPELDEKQDGNHLHFKRRNMVMYGAPGTGKTEFIKQLAHPNNPNYELLQEIERKPPCIIQIDGSTLATGGKAMPGGGQPDSYQKLVAIIKKAKEEYYGDPYSKKPYIVFVEEADQGLNVMTSGMAELKGEAQDKNSCIIIATNNYEIIDPALFRRDNNPEPEELYKVCTKIGFDVAKTELAKNLPIIINSWQRLNEKERKIKEQELDYLNNAKKIQRYDYGHAYRMEELQRALISNLCNNLIAFKNALENRLSEIRGELAANFQEISQLRGDLTILKSELKQAEQNVENIKNKTNMIIERLTNQMNLNNQNIARDLSSGISSLQFQINKLTGISEQLASKISSSTSSSSSGGVSVEEYNQSVRKYNSLQSKISQHLDRITRKFSMPKEIKKWFTKKTEYLLNAKQAGEALELLSSLEDNSVDLIFLDPQYEKVANVLKLAYPLYPQSDYQIMRIIEQENQLAVSQKKHPHQKPKGLIKALVEATTIEGDLIVDPELGRDYLGCDLTFQEMEKFLAS